MYTKQWRTNRGRRFREETSNEIFTCLGKIESKKNILNQYCINILCFECILKTTKSRK